MTSFHFPLQIALDWRRTQLALAEIDLRRQLAELAGIDSGVRVEASGLRPAAEFRSRKKGNP